ncbi:MAG: GNAT family N-acetyltransferase [Chloroflexi bacterium]|nr:GNAT family N-acetyltransferase [Chloroflexota bacterium]
MWIIELLDEIQTRAALPELIALLRDAVDDGASVGFLPPLDEQLARAYWAEVVRAVENQSRILLVARADLQIVGTVQLDLCTRQNGLHRAEVMKLLVHTVHRRQGIGEALMRALEREAIRAQRTTLILDTRVGDPSEALYAKLGYVRAGIIPECARSANGALDASAIYYRLLKDQ